MKFSEWIFKQKDRQDDVGQFAMYVASNLDFPLDATSDDMIAFTEDNYGDDAVAALRTALDEFKRSFSVIPPIMRMVEKKRAAAPTMPKHGEPRGVVSQGNMFAGHQYLDRSKLPLKPPGRN